MVQFAVNLAEETQAKPTNPRFNRRFQLLCVPFSILTKPLFTSSLSALRAEHVILK